MYAASLLGVPLALKLAPWEGAEEHPEDLHAAERLHRESQMYLALAGSSAVACTPRLIAHGYLRNDSGRRRAFLATSLIDGGRPVVDAASQLPAAKAVDLSRAAFSALCKLHLAGAAHLDISTGNVLMDLSGRVWLLDLEQVELDASEVEMREDFFQMSQVVQRAVRATGLGNEAEIEAAAWQGQQLYLSSMAPAATVRSAGGQPESPLVSSWQPGAARPPKTTRPPAEVLSRVTEGGGPPEYGGGTAARAIPRGRVTHGKQALLPKRLPHMCPSLTIRRLHCVRPAARLPM